ncbi:hypothetical protein G7Y89_g6153 [Cudoniella acicularis]|uniref:Uncharacterized protein n=1 Tax=Cudoniella acicularis TaxID=354080 RepID=A0A8H4RLV7_9HELO|nr:hypothetical protein G7Y89_g6153 [Cudoniella acicularis]
MEASRCENNFEVLIVGAGISGIIAAQRYLEAHPNCNLAILEKDSCVGGVFSKRRLYNEFWTQWTVGLAEYSDMPMEQPPEEDCNYDCFKAKYTTAYLEKYVDLKHCSGRSLRDRIRFGIQVQSIEKVEGKWILSCTDSSNKQVVFRAAKLMIANGENSLPNMLDLPGKETFGGTILHSEAFGKSQVLSDETIKHIAVMGAGKSAADMIYEAVKAGKSVSWIIRNTGAGAGFFAPIDLKTPYKNGVEAAQTRIMSMLQPSLLNSDNWFTWFLHSTSVGVGIVKWIFSALDKEVRKRADYKGRKSTKGFEKLEYEIEIFWQNNTGGALHHDDFWPLVAEHITIYRDGIKSLGNKTIYLNGGMHFPCDALLCGTGWKPGIEFFNSKTLLELGLPHLQKDEPYEVTAKWEKLILEADESVIVEGCWLVEKRGICLSASLSRVDFVVNASAVKGDGNRWTAADLAMARRTPNTIWNIKLDLQAVEPVLRSLDTTYRSDATHVILSAKVTRAKRAPHTAEVQHALAVNVAMAELDEDFLPEVEILGSLLCHLSLKLGLKEYNESWKTVEIVRKRKVRFEAETEGETEDSSGPVLRSGRLSKKTKKAKNAETTL